MLEFTNRSLRVLCLEDNPLIAFHLEQLIEDLGHVPMLTLSSFSELKKVSELSADCALIDIDLVDGRTGPEAAKWLRGKGVPSIFVTGQRELAEDYADRVVGILSKPISQEDLEEALSMIKPN